MVERSKSSLVLRLCQQLSNACRSLLKRFDSSVPHHFDKETCHGKISFFEAGKIKKKVFGYKEMFYMRENAFKPSKSEKRGLKQLKSTMKIFYLLELALVVLPKLIWQKLARKRK